MKIKGIALRTVQEQLDDGDPDVIVPEAIHNLPTEVPLSVNFGDHIGTAKVYLEDGRLVVEADIPEEYLKLNKLAVGYSFGGDLPPTLYEISITKENKDHGIPAYYIDEDIHDK